MNGSRFVVLLLAVAMPWPLSHPAVAAGESVCPDVLGPTASSATLVACSVAIDGGLRIPDGVSVEILEGSSITFTDVDEPALLLVESGGTLVLDGSSVVAEDGVELDVRFEAGSVGALRDATLTGYGVFETQSPLDVENVTFSDAQTALRVVGTQLVVRNSTVLGSVAASVGEDATVRFEGTTHVGSVDVASTGHFEVHWFVPVAVDVSASGQPGPAGLVVRDAADLVRFEAEPQDGEATVLRLPAELRHGAQRSLLNPYLFILTQGLDAVHVVADAAAGVDVQLVLPDDPDEAPPLWSDDAILQRHARSGFSTNGTVHLAWTPADDSVAGQRPNRAVSHYRILEGTEVLLARTVATEAAVEGLAQGTHALTVEAVDLVGNRAAAAAVDVLVDTRLPILAFEADADASAGGAFAGPVNVTVTATEEGTEPSGLRWLRWRVGDGPTTIHFADSSQAGQITDVVPFDRPGNHSLRVIVEDHAGNVVDVVHEVVIDTTPPSFSARLVPSLPLGGWHREAPTLHVTLVDAGPSGLDGVRYRVAGGAWTDYAEPVSLSTPGESLVEVEVADGAGNVARSQLRLAYDQDAPELETTTNGTLGDAGWFVGLVRLDASASDAASGLDRLEYAVAKGALQPLDGHVNVTGPGTHELSVRATDRAGNLALKALTVRIDAEAPTAPNVSWAARPDGRVVGDWTGDPPRDAVSGIATVRVERATQHGVPVESKSVDAEAAGYSFVGLAAGEHRLRVVVADVAGHESATAWSTVRSTGSASAQSAQTPARVRGLVSVVPDAAVAAEDLVEVRYFVDGVLLHATADAPYEYAWDTQGFANGGHEVRIVAVDAAGLHHEEVRTYTVRNGYAAAWADDLVPAAFAVGLPLVGLGFSVVGYVRWRRWGWK